MTPEALLAELKRRNVTATLAGDKIRLEAPAGALTPELKDALRQYKPELLARLQVHEETIWPGNTVLVYPMRPACRQAGHCLSLTRETDCELYLMRPGWCRERVSIRRQTYALH